MEKRDVRINFIILPELIDIIPRVVARTGVYLRWIIVITI